MGSYLDGYGVADARRERIRKRILIAAGTLLVLAGVLYFMFRNYREERQAKLFLDHLTRQDYKSAYALWGCTDARPCRDYGFERFLEDWGPKSPHAEVSKAHIGKVRSCSSGIIVTLEFPQIDPVLLWVERASRELSFSPWPICDPRIPTPSR